MRFNIRSMLVAVALSALNLAAAFATSGYAPPKSYDYPMLTLSSGLEPGPSGCLASFYDKPSTVPLPRRLVRALKEPAPVAPLQVWAPVIMSASITLLALTVASLRSKHRVRVEPENAGRAVRTRLSRVAATARWTAIICSLLALNIACAIYRPPAGPDESDAARQYLRGGIYLLLADGSFVFQRFSTLLLFTPYYHMDPKNPIPVPMDPGAKPDGRYLHITTIVLNTDGSILGYQGTAGQPASQPLVLRPPLRSALEMWWPVIASASITVLVTTVLWVHARRRRTNPVEEFQEPGLR